MKINEWRKFHGFTEEDATYIDKVKKIFSGKIDVVQTVKEYKKMNESITRMNKIKIDSVFIK